MRERRARPGSLLARLGTFGTFGAARFECGERRAYPRDSLPPDMDDPTRVEWREWGQAAFDEAAAADVPVLLSLTATWCDHCHEMDAETYADPRIAANVNDSFVPVRVDVDRRPRVRDRYNMGGFPSTVFLAPDGNVLTGAGYLGPDGMRQVVDSVRTMWQTNGSGAARVPRPLREGEPPAGELSPDIEAAMLGQLTESYDEVAGGWGGGPKFPLPDALEFALKRDREMALRSFDAVSANVFDEYDGGFYRFAAEPDWSGLQHEKLLDSNGALVRAFANAYLHTGDDAYREPAERTIEYLTTTLWNDEVDAFANSQAPGEPAAHGIDVTDRALADEPPVDDGVFAGPNALAIEGLLTYYAYTDDERARRYAERALETLRTELIVDGVVAHDLDGSLEADGSTCLLANQARTLAALTTVASTIDPDAVADACAVADATIDRLRDGGSFLDGPTEGVGLLERPLRPLDSNVAFADALVDLAALTGEKTYRTCAQKTLEAYAGASDRFGVQIARYATAVSRLLEGPLVIRVADEPGSDLHRAAWRLADHEKVVVPETDGDLEFGTARVERREHDSAAAETPEQLSDRLQTLLE
ncbi:Thioredoxin domain protein [Natrarchaeobaculum sulfurireducens]|uniref:Thioredoxin domain protein n=1 Tax=Natrarchaeobaculum sulfurireducens TaxID=2044521 RepID=A0A346PIJ5_9EURY|nr:Thioredoxin domain protein [Natrarchaeobaculum sulfurireducens]